MLRDEMRQSLRLIQSESDHLAVAVKSIQLIKHIIGRLRDHIRNHPFADRQEEIHHFKKEAPLFYSRLFYFLKVLQTELHRLHTSQAEMVAFLERELSAIDEFYRFQEDFCKMYYLGDTRIDDRLYIRNEAENPRSDDVEITMDSDYCVGCYYAARLFANKSLKVYLEKQCKIIQSAPAEDAGPQIKWEAGTYALGEVILAAYVSEWFGKARLKDIAAVFEKAARKRVGNINVIWQDMKRRKKEVAKNLLQAAEALNRKAAESA